MIHRSTLQLAETACATAGPIAGFVEAAMRLARLDAHCPVRLVDIIQRRSEAQRLLLPLTVQYEALCGDATVTACAPLREEIHDCYRQALGAAKRLQDSLQSAVNGIESDCREMIDAVRVLRTAVRAATTTIASTENEYRHVSTVYRAAVARGARVRALLAGAESHTNYAHLAFQVAVLLQRACDAFSAFLQLHAPPRPGLDP